jgi:sugar lactone lactonase YvrE
MAALGIEAQQKTGHHKTMKRILLVVLALLAVEVNAATWRVEPLTLTGATLNHPFGIVRGPDSCIYFCEIDGSAVRKIDAKGNLTNIGTGLKQPHELRFDKNGDLYVADTGNGRIVKVDLKTGALTPVATKLRSPISLQFNAAGELFVCEIGAHRIVKVAVKTGDVTPVVSEGVRGPRSIDFDRDGNLWIALREGNQVLKRTPDGKLEIIAGTGKSGKTGNGGPAKLATLSGPKGISVSPDGQRIFLADTESNSIRMIDLKTGNIELVADNIARPHGVFVEADGSLLVSDSYKNRILVLRPL